MPPTPGPVCGRCRNGVEGWGDISTHIHMLPRHTSPPRQISPLFSPDSGLLPKQTKYNFHRAAPATVRARHTNTNTQTAALKYKSGLGRHNLKLQHTTGAQQTHNISWMPSCEPFHFNQGGRSTYTI